MRYLVTGGAGSIGSNLIAKLLPNNIIAFDNNEYGLSCLPPQPNLQIAVGDIRDKPRLQELLMDVDVVVHCAALKRIEMAELNVAESIKTNVLGTMNVAEAAKGKRLLLISSDKAVPTTEHSLYGATKYLQEKIVLSAGGSVARLGNVVGTRGDVLETWTKQVETGKPLTITDPKMKRYFMSMPEAVQFILDCLDRMEGGEIFVPKLCEQGLMEFMQHCFLGAHEFEVTGLRAGEVLCHKLMTPNELQRAQEFEWGWVIR